VESYRPKKKAGMKKRPSPRHRVLANISHLPKRVIEQIEVLLKSPNSCVIKDVNSFFKGCVLYGGIVFFYLFMKRIGVLRALRHIPPRSRLLMTAVILNRILYPRSKLGSMEWIKSTAFAFLFGIEKKRLSVNQVYKSMDVFYRRVDKVMDDFFKHNRKGTQLFLYDVTSTFFEGEGPKDLARYGYSRDHRRDRPQVLLALVLNEKKLPVYFDIFEGNIQDKETKN
jgi:hypothetical protein